MQDPRIETLMAFVTAAPEGVSVAEIEQHLSPRVPRRTIQFWLALLIAQRRLRRKGAARAARYLARGGAWAAPTAAPAAAPAAESPRPGPLKPPAGKPAPNTGAAHAIVAKTSVATAAPVPTPPAAAASAPAVVPAAPAPRPEPPKPVRPVPTEAEKRLEDFYQESISRALLACVKPAEAPAFFRDYAQHRLEISAADAQPIVDTALAILRNFDEAAAKRFHISDYQLAYWRQRSGFGAAPTTP